MIKLHAADGGTSLLGTMTFTETDVDVELALDEGLAVGDRFRFMQQAGTNTTAGGWVFAVALVPAA